MALVQVVFYSRSKVRIGESIPIIKRILHSCSEYSPVSGLTGGLVFNEKFFIQAMEGSRDQISRQLARLFADSRHESLTIASTIEIDQREFDGWSVGYAGHTTDSERLYLKYGLTVDINPHAMTAKAIAGFVREYCRLETPYVQHAGIGDHRMPSVAEPPAERFTVTNTLVSN